MSNGGRVLAIDFGTSFTTVALRRSAQSDVLKSSRSESNADRMPSVIMLADNGELLVGWQAERQAELAPERVERTPKQDLEPGRLLDLGEKIEVVDAVARILEVPYQEGLAQAGGTVDEVWLTHPASWGKTRLDALCDAAARAGIEKPQLIPEPVAAALWLARESETRLPVGSQVAVYDLGGGTFDTAVLTRTHDGFELAGPPGGQMGLGGESFDEKLLGFVRDVLETEAPDDLAAIESRPQSRSALREQVRRVKEDLSSSTSATVLLPSASERQTVHVSRDDLNALIRADIERSVEILKQTIAQASTGLQGLSAIYLAGGSSRIKLVADLVGKHTGRVPKTLANPKTAVVLGATQADTARPKPKPAPKARPKTQPRPRPKVEVPKPQPTPEPSTPPRPLGLPVTPPPQPTPEELERKKKKETQLDWVGGLVFLVLIGWPFIGAFAGFGGPLITGKDHTDASGFGSDYHPAQNHFHFSLGWAIAGAAAWSVFVVGKRVLFGKWD